jgi:hypothetical protein
MMGSRETSEGSELLGISATVYPLNNMME